LEKLFFLEIKTQKIIKFENMKIDDNIIMIFFTYCSLAIRIKSTLT